MAGSKFAPSNRLQIHGELHTLVLLNVGIPPLL